MSESDDDVPLGKRGVTAATPAVKKEPVTAPAKSAPQASAKAPAQKPGAKAAAVKKEVKAEPSSKAAAKAVVKAEGGKEPKVKKEFELPGQTRDTPPETDGLRKFYTSLLSQRPDSDMAKKWCCQHGLLPAEEAEAYVEELRKQRGAVKSPVKSEKPRAAPAAKKPSDKKPAGKASDKQAVKRKAEAPAPAPPAKKKVAAAKKPVLSDSDDEVPLNKRAAAAQPAAATKRPVKRVCTLPMAANQDVAFADGGLDGSDDDDLPLAQRTKA